MVEVGIMCSSRSTFALVSGAQMNKDYYAILGVLPSVEDFVIRAAYRALAQRYHPDKLPDCRATAEARMREINEAYAMLSDERLRAQYDARGASVRSSSITRAAEGSAPVGHRQPPQNDALVIANRLRLNETFGYAQVPLAARAHTFAVHHISEFA